MVVNAFFRNIDFAERSQVHDIKIVVIDYYKFQQFPKYSLFKFLHY